MVSGKVNIGQSVIINITHGNSSAVVNIEEVETVSDNELLDHQVLKDGFDKAEKLVEGFPLDIGTLVGEPTFGAVISTGSARLIDGSSVRMPFRGWYVKSTGDNMDFVPAVPDVLVLNNPDDKANKKDTQLKKAVDELLKQL